MSSVYDSGKSFDAAIKGKQSTCKKSKDGKHDWKKFGQWPSNWEECTKCKETIFYK